MLSKNFLLLTLSLLIISGCQQAQQSERLPVKTDETKLVTTVPTNIIEDYSKAICQKTTLGDPSGRTSQGYEILSNSNINLTKDHEFIWESNNSQVGKIKSKDPSLVYSENDTVKVEIRHIVKNSKGGETIETKAQIECKQ